MRQFLRRRCSLVFGKKLFTDCSLSYGRTDEACPSVEGLAADRQPAPSVEALEAAVLAHVGGILADDLAALVLRVLP